MFIFSRSCLFKMLIGFLQFLLHLLNVVCKGEVENQLSFATLLLFSLYYLSIAIAYNFICLIIDNNPFALVAESCSFKPILLIKSNKIKHIPKSIHKSKNLIKLSNVQAKYLEIPFISNYSQGGSRPPDTPRTPLGGKICFF